MVECWLNGNRWDCYSRTELLEVLRESFAIRLDPNSSSVEIARVMNSLYANTVGTTVYYLAVF